MNSCTLLAVLVAVAVASVVALPPRQTLLSLSLWDTRIVGGEPIDITEAPFQVSLQVGRHFCGGSIIGSRFILTAGHCTEGVTANKLSVRVGSSKHGSEGHLMAVKKIHTHEKFVYETVDYDFSVLELAEEIVFDDTKQPIALPKGVLDDGVMLNVTGWGETRNSEESREVLRRASVLTMNQEACKKAYDNMNEVTDRMMCAGLEEGGKDACKGDSGGPLYMNGTVYGVVSWGWGCAKGGYPGVYGKVSAVVDWIRDIIN